MRELLTGHETTLSDREIIGLYNEANAFLSTPEGNKVLREFLVLEAYTHGILSFVDNERTYNAEDYLKHPELFSVTGFGSAVFMIDKGDEGRLFSTQEPFAHFSILEEKVTAVIPNLQELFQDKEFKITIGYVAQVKDNPLKLFRNMWNKECNDEIELALYRAGWLPMQPLTEGCVRTTDDQLHKMPSGLSARSDFVKCFKDAETFKDTEWEIFPSVNPPSILS